MKKVVLVLAVFYAVAGCNLMKKTAENSVKESEQYKNNTDLIAHTDTQSFRDSTKKLSQNDVVEADYTFRFYPRGNVNLDKEGKISASFDSILLTGKHKSLTTLEDATQIRERENTGNSLQLKQKINKTAEKKTKEKETEPDLKLGILAGIIVGVAIVILIFRSK